jgi:hypothetical protein
MTESNTPPWTVHVQQNVGEDVDVLGRENGEVIDHELVELDEVREVEKAPVTAAW